MTLAPGSAIPPATRAQELWRAERAALLLLVAVTFGLRAVYVFRFRIHSDEPQHLHVVWAWANGLLPYRDVFDNHTPLFHMLCTPLYRAVGERPDIIVWMRLPMLPLYLLALWAVYRIGEELFSHRAACWGTLLVSAFPPFFFCSLEFRTDDLWMALWLAALVVLVRGRVAAARSFMAGLILGAAMMASMKTILLLVALGAAIAWTLGLLAARREPVPWHRVRRCALAGGLGLVIVPAAVSLGFIWAGAWREFLYGTVGHNLDSGLGSAQYRWPLFLAGLPVAGWIAGKVLDQAGDPRRGIRRAGIFLTAQLYVSALLCFWPILQRQHGLPFYPLAVLLVTALITARVSSSAERAPWQVAGRTAVLLPAAAALFEIGWLVFRPPLTQNNTGPQARLLAEVLRLTSPADTIMDIKGETVFRRRTFFYTLEIITLQKIRRGLIADTIPEALVASRTPVATVDGPTFPPHGRTFMNANYVLVGRLRVAGRFLDPPGAPTAPLAFEIAVPARYAIVSEEGRIGGVLDGMPLARDRFLDPGHHEFQPARPVRRAAVVWAQAIDRGFSPYGQRLESP